MAKRDTKAPVRFRVRNWATWQSYRSDRGRPPWIKVHRRLLQDSNWVQLSDADRAHVVTLWMLAADRDGVIPDTPQIAQRIGMLDSPPDYDKLLSLGFIETYTNNYADDSRAPDANVASTWRQPDANVASTWRQPDANVASTWRQVDAPEAEEEAESETEADRSARSASVCPLAGFPELQATFPRIDAVLREVQPSAKPLGYADRDALAKLHRIDGYPQREILQALHWLFRSQDADAVFWRAQVFALAPLRKAKDGATKFDRIHAAWKRAAAASAAQQEKNKPADRIQQQTENRIRESLGLAKVS